MLIGAHVPTMGDFRKMAAYAAQVGCECVQVFSCSPRSYAVPPAPEKTLRQLEALRAPGANPACPPMLVHAGYLINLASDNPEQLAKSRDSFAGEIVRAHAMGAQALNVHTGSSKELPRDEVAARIARTVAEARELAAQTAGPQVNELPVVFEDTAGAGDTYGTTVGELAAILRELAALGRPDAEAGICIDTCHAWAAGYDLSSHGGWDELLGEIDELCAPKAVGCVPPAMGEPRGSEAVGGPASVTAAAGGSWPAGTADRDVGGSGGGLARLRWIHANDCKFERGSRKDRHEWIGRGCIGFDGFADMVRRPELAHVSVVVEMPGEMPEKDEVNVRLLQSLRNEG